MNNQENKLNYSCPKCGSICEYALDFNGLCKECFKAEQKKQLVPIKLEGVGCYNCSQVKIDSLWRNRQELEHKVEKMIKNQINSDIKAQFSIRIREEDYRRFFRRNKVRVTYKAKFENIFVGESDLFLSIHPKLCPECRKKLSGNLNEAILWIRPKTDVNETIQRILQEIEKIFYEEGRGEYINIKRMSKGIDIFLSSKIIAEKIIGVLRNNFSLQIQSYSTKKKDETLEKTRTVKKTKILVK